MTIKSNQFYSKLDPKSAAIGIRLAYENAELLLKDAELLFANRRFERAVALAILAIEEAGKSTIIRGILLADDPRQLKKEWRNYRQHTQKNLAWILPHLVAKGASKLEELSQIFNPASDHGVTLDNIKQLSLYTDIFGSGQWSKPSDTVDDVLARQILLIADSIVRIEKVMTSERELELWVKFLKPARNLGRKGMKEALRNCYAEAEKLGIMDREKISVLTQFLQ